MSVDEFRAASGRAPAECPIAAVMKALTPAQRRDLKAAMEDPTVSLVGMATVLKKWGHPASNTCIRKHRIGLCHCA